MTEEGQFKAQAIGDVDLLRSHDPFIKVQVERAKLLGLVFHSYASVTNLDQRSGFHYFVWKKIGKKIDSDFYIELTPEQRKFLNETDDGQAGGEIVFDNDELVGQLWLWCS